MTTYCSICRQSTEDRKEVRRWGKNFLLVVVHCGKCGLFKYQYLEDSTNTTNTE